MESEMQKTNIVTKGKRWRGKNWEIWIDIDTLIYTKQITNNDLLYNAGTLFNTLQQPIWEKSIKEWL